ncbi:MAG TPA: prepilin-type N-terminal cleavage/methylation domain-containing protein, partial [Legionellaceae bacterium]|nr:prepilin-type N-terminal cleavage/methylation domain-containing protein [Legionellaceae bacterium]
MNKRGFSLSEVLIALMLMVSISLALLKQQWQITRLRVQIEKQAQDFLSEKNAWEKGCDKIKQCGMSLLELMIALGLSLSMMTLLMQEYMQIQAHYQRTEKIIDDITQLQFVLNFISDQIHQIGFTPCVPLRLLRTFDHRSSHALKTLQFDAQMPSKITFSFMDAPYHLVETIESEK